MSDIIKPTPQEQAQIRTLQNSYFQNMSSFNKLTSNSPYDGHVDNKLGEIRLRLAMIDNSEVKRPKYTNVDPLNIKNVINLNTGNIVLRWLDIPGNSIRADDLDGEWKYVREKDFYNPDDRDFDEWEITSRREMVSLTHPFIWADAKNYCGFNYIPPVGSIVVVGFKKHNMPVILGYISNHYKVCYPVLKPGEMVMKGYGNNYAHWRWSDKMDIKVWSKENEVDIDDPDYKQALPGIKPKTNSTNCTLTMKFNANDRYIEIVATEVDNTPPDGTEQKYNENFEKPDGTHKTKLVIRPKNLLIESREIVGGSYNDSGHSDLRFTRILQDEEKVVIEAHNTVKKWETTRKQSADSIETTAKKPNETSTVIQKSNQIISKVNDGNVSTLTQTGSAFTFNSKSFVVNTEDGITFASSSGSLFEIGDNVNIKAQNYTATFSGNYAIQSSVYSTNTSGKYAITAGTIENKASSIKHN